MSSSHRIFVEAIKLEAAKKDILQMASAAKTKQNNLLATYLGLAAKLDIFLKNYPTDRSLIPLRMDVEIAWLENRVAERVGDAEFAMQAGSEAINRVYGFLKNHDGEFSVSLFVSQEITFVKLFSIMKISTDDFLGHIAESQERVHNLKKDYADQTEFVALEKFFAAKKAELMSRSSLEKKHEASRVKSIKIAAHKRSASAEPCILQFVTAGYAAEQKSKAKDIQKNIDFLQMKRYWMVLQYDLSEDINIQKQLRKRMHNRALEINEEYRKLRRYTLHPPKLHRFTKPLPYTALYTLLFDDRYTSFRVHQRPYFSGNFFPPALESKEISESRPKNIF